MLHCAAALILPPAVDYDVGTKPMYLDEQWLFRMKNFWQSTQTCPDYQPVRRMPSSMPSFSTSKRVNYRDFGRSLK